jgi:hypothetical protein
VTLRLFPESFAEKYWLGARKRNTRVGSSMRAITQRL